MTRDTAPPTATFGWLCCFWTAHSSRNAGTARACRNPCSLSRRRCRSKGPPGHLRRHGGGRRQLAMTKPSLGGAARLTAVARAIPKARKSAYLK